MALVILRLVTSDHLPAHLLLGSDAVQYASQAEAARSRREALARDQPLDRCRCCGFLTFIAILKEDRTPGGFAL